jgi:hypothetical protein
MRAVRKPSSSMPDAALTQFVRALERVHAAGDQHVTSALIREIEMLPRQLQISPRSAPTVVEKQRHGLQL